MGYECFGRIVADDESEDPEDRDHHQEPSDRVLRLSGHDRPPDEQDQGREDDRAGVEDQIEGEARLVRQAPRDDAEDQTHDPQRDEDDDEPDRDPPRDRAFAIRVAHRAGSSSWTGSRTAIRVPRPGSLVTSRVPSRASTRSCTI